jgi:protein involved in polysaccharide export with SLBB domain
MTKTYKTLLFLLAFPLIGGSVSGCRTHTVASSQKNSRDNTVPAGNNPTTSTNAPSESVELRPGLLINVNVLVAGKNEIAAPGKRITDKGTISMPLLGNVQVSDQSLESLSVQLTSAYKEFFVNPQVIVEFVRDDNKEGLSPWGNVTVLGRVKKPGRISLPATRDLTLSGAIQQAGGYDTSAKENAIRITRKQPGGGVKKWEVDLRSVGAEGLIENDVLMEPDDVVYIPQLIF